MIIRQLYKIFILLAIALFAITCNKLGDSDLICTDKNTNPVQTAISDYFIFKEGSSWIYKKENSDITDSVWVSSVQFGTGNLPDKSKRACNCGWGKCTSSIYITYLHKQSDRNYKEVFRKYFLRSDDDNADYTSVTTSGNNEISTYDWLTYENGSIKAYDDYHNDVEIYNELTIENTDYKDVLVYTAPVYNAAVKEKAWYAKKFYLVKFRKSDSTTWNLVKYNIVK